MVLTHTCMTLPVHESLLVLLNELVRFCDELLELSLIVNIFAQSVLLHLAQVNALQ